MPRTSSLGKKILIGAFIIAIIVAGIAGVYFLAAMPSRIFSTSIDTTGILVSETYDVAVSFPKSQMQVSVELSSTPLSWSIQVRNSTDDVIQFIPVPSGPGTFTSVWFNAPPGLYKIVVSWNGELTVQISAYARGPPYAT